MGQATITPEYILVADAELASEAGERGSVSQPSGHVEALNPVKAVYIRTHTALTLCWKYTSPAQYDGTYHIHNASGVTALQC